MSGLLIPFVLLSCSFNRRRFGHFDLTCDYGHADRGVRTRGDASEGLQKRPETKQALGKTNLEPQQDMTDGQIRVMQTHMKEQYRAVKAGRAIGGKEELLQDVRENFYLMIGCLEQEWSQSERSDEECETQKGHGGKTAGAHPWRGTAVW